MKTAPKITGLMTEFVTDYISRMKSLGTFALATLLTVLSAFASSLIHRTDAPDGFYVGADTAPSYALQIPPTDRSSGVILQIREDDTFIPKHFVVFATDQIRGGYFAQVSGQSTEKMLDLPGIVLVANRRAYFGYARRVGSSKTVSLLVDNREDAEAVSSMLHKKFPLAQSSVNLQATNTVPSEYSAQDLYPSTNWHWDQAMADALSVKINKDYDYNAISAFSRMMLKARVNGMPEPSSQFPLPNAEAYAHHPLPAYVNFYCINDHYPDYLLCQYDVDEKNYDQSKESAWFIESLKQIRHSGPTKFPRSIQWVAVIIKNRAEHKDASTFEQSHKVGAIFRASDVFDSSHNLSQLVASAVMDRHPFKYDQIQPDSQRVLIVEQHSATNKPTTGDKK
jgi:hypothetical protein